MSKVQGLRVLLTGGPGPLEGALRDRGHRIDASPDAASAVAVARYAPLDVVILRPEEGVTPFALAKEIRAASLWRKPMFVAIAASASGNCEACCREAGIDLLLVEPVAAELVAQFLDRLGAIVADFASFDPMI